METWTEFDWLERLICLEPEVGKNILPFYPEFLSTEEKQTFEEHLQICDYCQQHWEFWRTTGFTVRVASFVEHACALLAERRIDEALAAYNHAITIDPKISDTEIGRQFFLADAWLVLTAAHSKEQDILAYLAPTHTPLAEEMAAAKPIAAFPVLLEYAQGAVTTKITAMGTFICFYARKS